MIKNLAVAIWATIGLWSGASGVSAQQFVELEQGTLFGNYASTIDEPFGGVAVYGNGDGVSVEVDLGQAPGVFELSVTGASSNDSQAGVAIYLNGTRLASIGFRGTSPSTQTVEFELEKINSSDELRFELETDNGNNDTFLDSFTLLRSGDIPPPPPPPILPESGAYQSGQYRNMFAGLTGVTEEEVQARVNRVYDQLFHSLDQENEAIFIPVGDDMAYIWDTGNDDVRSEGMSYGMMMAVQMDRKEDFDRLWKWAHTYSRNTEGDMKGYYAWQVTTSGQIRDKNPAPDGEEYFATALFFASHRWGDGEGIYNYSAQANQLLDDMFDNGETRYADGGVLESFSLFNRQEMQIVFSPATPSNRAWTDPSYHLPAFYELWARWADNNNEFWAELAETSRAFWKTTVHPDTGLSPDYAYFDGRPHGDFQNWKDTFQYDAWRTVGNAALDYYWWQKDPWQVTYAETLQSFFASQGVKSYGSLFELNGDPYTDNADHTAHSPGLVAMNAMASFASDEVIAWEFVEDLWKTATPTGRYRYYDGCLYMFAMLALSGNYRIYCPDGECPAQISVPSPQASSSQAQSSSSSAINDQTNGAESSSVSSESSDGTRAGSLTRIHLLLLLLLGVFKVSSARFKINLAAFYARLIGHKEVTPLAERPM